MRHRAFHGPAVLLVLLNNFTSNLELKCLFCNPPKTFHVETGDNISEMVNPQHLTQPGPVIDWSGFC